MKHISVALISALFVLTGGATPGIAQQTEEHGQMETSVETTNKELVSRFFEQFSNGDIDGAFAMVSDDVSWWVPGDLPFSGTKTKAEYLGVVAGIQSGVPEGRKLDAVSMIAEGDKVAVEVESLGQHVNGRTYTNKYHFLITVQDGQMVEVKEYMDTLHLYQLIQP
jgi:ketosteroid isomerase-like protein